MTNMPALDSPFHAGEQQVQERLGVRDIEEWARQVVRPELPEQHRAFYASLPFLIVSARDRAGRPWASLLAGPDGVATTPDPKSLAVTAIPGEGDPLHDAFLPGADVGILGIEFATRRRNRVNGTVYAVDPAGFTLSVAQGFGNCPQYIREREWTTVEQPQTAATVASDGLSPAQQQWIRSSDTFFIASGHRGTGVSPAYGMDASHRGGDPGFVKVVDANRVMFPDYAGNNHYNTVGNLVVDPRVGLLFVDFTAGSLLQVTGRAHIDWDSDAVATVPGARRLIEIEIESVVEQSNVLPIRWSETADSVRSLRLIDKVSESNDVTTFLFAARDGGPLPPFEAGQHLPLELDIPGFETPLSRTYSLSGAPGADCYRITVKREPHGAASRYLHDQVDVGAILEARKPAGDFVLPSGSRPVVLVSAGVGVTPMASMLHALASDEGHRPVWFIHGARDSSHQPLVNEAREIAATRPNVRVHVAFSRPRDEDQPGVHFDSEGRVDADLLERLVDVADADYLLCGPTTFMATLQDDLRKRGVDPDRIHSETFGPRS